MTLKIVQNLKTGHRNIVFLTTVKNLVTSFTLIFRVKRSTFEIFTANERKVVSTQTSGKM